MSEPSTVDRTAEALRTSILSGALPPGTPLREQSLATELGVSRNSVREAFRLLTQEGLATHNKNSGVRVTEVSVEDVADLYAVRAVLEGTAIDAFAAASEDARDAFAASFDAYEAAVAGGETIGIANADFAFHRALVAILDSHRLDAFFAGLLSELRLALVLSDREGIDYERQLADHRGVRDAVIGGNAPVARLRLGRHLTEARDRLVEVL